MLSELKAVKKVSYGSMDWANDILRCFLNDILYEKTWVYHPYNKLIVGYDVIDRLEVHGFWWQAERLKNHLHRWMKRSCKSEGFDTLDLREREDSL